MKTVWVVTPNESDIPLEFSNHEYRMIERAARLAGLTVSQWCYCALVRAARAEIRTAHKGTDPC